MYNFRYVTKKEKIGVKKELISIINDVQDEVRKYFTFNFQFVGSEKMNLVTCDFGQNIGFDFDVDLAVNDDEENYSPKEIKHILMNAFNKVINDGPFLYNCCEDSTRVFTIKVKDTENRRILHSCDFCIINECKEGTQFIRFNKKQNSYYWDMREFPDSEVARRVDVIKANSERNNLKDLYLYKKNTNSNRDKKSRSLRLEAINEIYNLIKKEEK